MTDDTPELLRTLRDLLVAIRREAGHRDAIEIVELAEQAETITGELIRRSAH